MSIKPAYRFSVTPFGSGRDPRAVTIHVHRVDGSPERDFFGERLITAGFTQAELQAEMHRIVSQLGNQVPNASAKAEPASLPLVNGRIVPPEVSA